jgi:hypothetical protein
VRVCAIAVVRHGSARLALNLFLPSLFRLAHARAGGRVCGWLRTYTAACGVRSARRTRGRVLAAHAHDARRGLAARDRVARPPMLPRHRDDGDVRDVPRRGQWRAGAHGVCGWSCRGKARRRVPRRWRGYGVGLLRSRRGVGSGRGGGEMEVFISHD